MRTANQKTTQALPVAVVVSDLHLSEKAPTARKEQGADWEAAMEAVLYELRITCDKHRVPLIIAGDLFDVPKPSPALIRLAWLHLPKTVYVVAGNHDLPNHSMVELPNSGLGLMIHAERVTLLKPWAPVKLGDLKKRQVHVWGFSWGDSFGMANALPEFRNVAVIHRYCWVEGHTHPGAKPEDHIDVQIDDLMNQEFCAAVWGDNHRNHWKPKERGEGTTSWYNSGVAIPRNCDFKDYTPTYALLMDDGTFKVQEFKAEVEWQPWVDVEKTEKATATLLEFAREVAGLVGSKVSENFLDELETAMSGVKDENVRKKVWEILQMAQRTKR